MQQKFKVGDKVQLTRLGLIFLEPKESAHVGMEMTVVAVRYSDDDRMLYYQTNYMREFADFEMEAV